MFPSRSQQTWVSFPLSMCCGSKAERREITTTLLGAVTGLLPTRDSTCRPSQPSSSNQTCPFSALTWGDQRRTCADAGETWRVYFLIFEWLDSGDLLCPTVHPKALNLKNYLRLPGECLSETGWWGYKGYIMNGDRTWETFHVALILAFGLFYISYYNLRNSLF